MLFRSLAVAMVLCASLACSAQADVCFPVAHKAAKVVAQTARCTACVVREGIVEPTLAGLDAVRDAVVERTGEVRSCLKCHREARRVEREARYAACDCDATAKPSAGEPAQPFSGEVVNSDVSTTK